MARFFRLVLFFALFSLQARCQTVQDDWTSPASPDNSTTLQSGNPFSLIWKSELQSVFSDFCTACDVQKLDLWITTFDGDDYNYKIAAGINLTTTLTYDWNVNIPTAALADKIRWVFRFTPFGSTPPFDEQISSAAVNIVGPDEPSTTSSSTTPSATTTSSIATSSTITSSSTTATESTSSSPVVSNATSTSTKSKTWIAGVVIGPLVGIALGAALTWFLLRQRRAKTTAQQDSSQPNTGNLGHIRDDDPPELVSGQKTWGENRQPLANTQLPAYHDQEPVEMDGHNQHAELWHGNYR